MSLYQSELKWIHSLQDALRSPGIDAFFIEMNHLDSIGFAMAIVCISWHLVSRRIGIKLFYIFILSAVINKFLKTWFGLPRPCQVDSTVAVLCTQTFGLPSGAGQTSVIIAGIVMLEFRKRMYWYLGILFGLLLSFSRIYLGLHYFTDILLGWIIGLGLLAIYWKLFPIAEKKWKIFIFSFPLLVLLFVQSFTSYFLWVSIGVAIGLMINDKKQRMTKISWAQKWVRTVIVLAGLMSLYWGVIYYPQFTLLFALLSGLWLTFPFVRPQQECR